MVKVSIIGSGVVGAIAGRGFMKLSYEVIFHDIVNKNLPNFTNDINYAIENSDVSFICVPTPATPSGIDLSYVKEEVYAYAFKGKRYDAGDKLGYVNAIIDFALESEDLKEEIRKYLQDIGKEGGT